MSWVALADVLGAVRHCLAAESLQGPVNVVAPGAVTNAEFARTLGHALRRPTFLRVPRAMLELALGDMAREVLLSSARVVPRKLLDSGYRFAAADLTSALRAEYGSVSRQP
jgi:NAD dependent epimerase/dehydratase family enzyme